MATVDQVPHTLSLTCSLILRQDVADTVGFQEDEEAEAAAHDSDERQSARLNRKR